MAVKGKEECRDLWHCTVGRAMRESNMLLVADVEAKRGAMVAVMEKGREWHVEDKRT